MIDALEINPAQVATASVIWLHGLGADGHDFEPIVPELGLANDKAVRFIFPHAPVRPITINGGLAMRGWFDILGFDFNSAQDEKGIRESAAMVNHLIDQERSRNIPAERIILAGFSQGGAMALHCGLRHPETLGGIIALSTFLPLAEKLPQEINSVNQHIPIFMAHGSEDPLLPIQLGEASRDYLAQHQYQVEWHSYPMPHSVCPEEIVAIGEWLNNLL